MPVTPFHFGPGLLVKSLLDEKFSMGLFMLVNVVIDVESGTNLLLHRHPVHGPLHTFLGASIVAVLCVFLGGPLYNRLLKWWGKYRKQPDESVKLPTEQAVWSGAIVGAWSHVVLDALMHPDASPFAPLHSENRWLIENFFVREHIYCAIAGVVGLVIWGLKFTKTKKSLHN